MPFAGRDKGISTYRLIRVVRLCMLLVAIVAGRESKLRVRAVAEFVGKGGRCC